MSNSKSSPCLLGNGYNNGTDKVSIFSVINGEKWFCVRPLEIVGLLVLNTWLHSSLMTHLIHNLIIFYSSITTWLVSFSNRAFLFSESESGEKSPSGSVSSQSEKKSNGVSSISPSKVNPVHIISIYFARSFRGRTKFSFYLALIFQQNNGMVSQYRDVNIETEGETNNIQRSTPASPLSSFSSLMERISPEKKVSTTPKPVSKYWKFLQYKPFEWLNIY